MPQPPRNTLETLKRHGVPLAAAAVILVGGFVIDGDLLAVLFVLLGVLVVLETRARLRNRLVASEAQLEAVFATSLDGILVLDAELEVVSANPAAERIFGSTELVGRTLTDLVERSDDLPAVGERRQSTGVRSSGETFPLEMALTPRHVVGDEGHTAVVRDITQEVEAKEQLERARDDAMAGAVAKSLFLANMSHEIRTPMNGVLGTIELLLDEEEPGARREALETIRRSAQSLLTILDDVLDYSRLTSGRMPLHPTSFDLGQLVEDVAALFTDTARGKAIRLVLESSVSGIWVRGDPNRIRQVINNLVSNAVKFTRVGSVTIRARLESGTLEVEVEDTGPGIPDTLASRIFERFTQGESSLARKHGGTGLGLAISKGLAELMGGDIVLESEVGRGSVFRFSCPLERAAARPTTGRHHVGTMLSGRVLIAEDNLVNQRIAQKMVERMGCEVEVAADGSAALELAAKQRFDVILMDVQMPFLDGYEVTLRIRTGVGPNKNTPIVALTANVLPEQRERALRSGMNDHLGKPIVRQRLLEVLTEWMTPAEGSPPHRASA